VLLQAASFRLSHEKVFTPLVTLAMLIQNNPQLASIKKIFPKVAQQLMASVSVLAYGDCPQSGSTSTALCYCSTANGFGESEKKGMD
jgi:hypothetical protein